MNMGGRGEKGINTPNAPLSCGATIILRKVKRTADCFHLLDKHFCSWGCTKNPQVSQGNLEVLVICQLGFNWFACNRKVKKLLA